MSRSEPELFYPSRFLSEDVDKDSFPTLPDLVILNQPIAHFAVFSRLWTHSRYRICADGGANRLFDMFQGDLIVQREQYLPDAIHGDLDSLRDDVRDYYTAQGVEVSQNRSVENTDFGKTMQKISSRIPTTALQEVVILGTLGGRVDQGLRMLHDLIAEETSHPNLRLWLFSESSISFILKSRYSLIRGLQSGELFTENVGLIPIYGPAIISTVGLEWDVKDWETHIGGRVSSSNHIKADEVHVETNAPILFTIERA